MPRVSVGDAQMRLRHLVRLVSAHFDGFLVDTGLTMTQYVLLQAVDVGEPVQQGVVAHKLGLSTSTLTRTFMPLLDAGLIEYVQTGRRLRGRLVCMTAPGKARMRAAQQLAEGAREDLSRRLGAPLLDQLEQSVDRAVRVLFETAPRSESGRSVEHPEVLMQD